MSELAGMTGPYFIGPAHPCNYCGREIRTYGSREHNTSDGEPHTCSAEDRFRMTGWEWDARGPVGPVIIAGDWWHFDFPTPDPQRAEAD